MMTEQEMDKLKRAAFEVLRDNDGCECQDWIILRERVRSMEALLAEKKRLINVLMNKSNY